MSKENAQRIVDHCHKLITGWSLAEVSPDEDILRLRALTMHGLSSLAKHYGLKLDDESVSMGNDDYLDLLDYLINPF